MNDSDLSEFRVIVESAVEPACAAAQSAANAALEAKEEVKGLRLELNGEAGYPGIKVRLGMVEARCEARHSTDTTAQRSVFDAAAARALLPRTSDRPSARREKLHIARWQAVTAIAVALIGLAGAYFIGKGGAPSTPPAAAAPMH